MTLMNMGAILPLVRDGKLRGLAVTSLKRSPIISELPTLAESGFPDFEAIAWIGFMAPAGTPRSIVEQYHREIVRILNIPDVRQRLLDINFEIVASTPEAFADYIRWETPRWAKVIRDTGAKAN